MNIRLRFLLTSLWIAAPFSMEASAQEWTRFRGPNGTGISTAKGVPVAWTERDFLWRVPIPGESHSQPVIWGDRLFVLTAEDGGTERALLCLRKTDGGQLWARTYPAPADRPGNKNASFANTSAVVDAERVIALFVSKANFWVRAFDHDGKELWSRDLGPFVSQHGHGASPIIYENTVIVTNEQAGPSFVVALDLKSGQTVWSAERLAKRNGAAYGTPIVLSRPGAATELLLASQAHGLSSIDPRTGVLNWEAPVFEKRMVSSPVLAGDLVIGTCGQGGSAASVLTAVKLGGKGNVSETHVAYSLRQRMPYVPTSLYRNGRLYTVSDFGIASALDAATGREIWSERLPGEFFASPIWIDGKIYLTSVKGDVFVLKERDTFELLATNPLGEGTHSTPCVDGGRLYVKTFTHLVCVGRK